MAHERPSALAPSRRGVVDYSVQYDEFGPLSKHSTDGTAEEDEKIKVRLLEEDAVHMLRLDGASSGLDIGDREAETSDIEDSSSDAWSSGQVAVPPNPLNHGQTQRSSGPRCHRLEQELREFLGARTRLPGQLILVSLSNSISFFLQAQLLAYRQQHGNCNVPLKYKENTNSLGFWVGYQRQEYYWYQNGYKSSMTKERIAKLEKVGLPCARWNDRYMSSLEREPHYQLNSYSYQSLTLFPTRRRRKQTRNS